MATKTKAFLGAAIVALAAGLAFVTGLINVHSLKLLYVALPVGAIFFGMFLVARLFEKETEAYDTPGEGNRDSQQNPPASGQD